MTAAVTVVVQVPLVDGKPALQLPAGVEVVREGRYAHISWGVGGALSLVHLGTPGSGPVFCGQMTERAARRLDHLGATVRPLAWFETNAPTQRDWLIANGVREVGGRLYPPHVIAGAAVAPDEVEGG